MGTPTPDPKPATRARGSRPREDAKGSTPAERARLHDKNAEELEKAARGMRDRARALRLGSLTGDVREGEPTVRIVAHVEAMTEREEAHEVDSEWWHALTDRERDQYLTDTATDEMNNAGGCGASVEEVQQ